jgi:hypothetical protein
VTDPGAAPERDRQAVVEAFIAQNRANGPGRGGPRAAAAVAVLLLALVGCVLVGYLTRLSGTRSPSDCASPAAGSATPASCPTP